MGASGGAMSSVGFQGSRPVLTNCVVWGNGGASTFANGPGSSITTSYSLFESSVTGYNHGTGNLTTTTSPFVSATDMRLNGCAPALNSGDNAAYSAVNGPATDLAGNARVFPSGGRIDIGAYEYQTTGSLSISTPSVNSATMSVGFDGRADGQCDGGGQHADGGAAHQQHGRRQGGVFSAVKPIHWVDAQKSAFSRG